MNTVRSSHWPESPYVKTLFILLALSPFAFIGTFIDRDVWYIAALPSASLTLGWLGRRLLRLDDDQQPGAATSIRQPSPGSETIQSRRTGDSTGIAAHTGPNG